MSEYKPDLPYAVPFRIMQPKSKEKIKGTVKKTYEKLPDTYYCSFRTFGGTERESNGLLSIEDTAVIETWYIPELQADCLIEVNGTEYDILGTPENIKMQNRYLKFRVRACKGGC